MKKLFSFLCFLLLFLGINSAYALQWDELDKKFDQQYAGRDFNKALATAESCLNLAEKEFEQGTKEYRKTIQNLARVYAAKEMWGKSLDFYNELLNVEITRIAKIDTTMSTSLQSIVSVYKWLNDKKAATEVYDKATVRLSKVTVVDHSIYTELSDYYTKKIYEQSGYSPPATVAAGAAGNAQPAGEGNDLVALAARCREHKVYGRIANGKEDCGKLYTLMQEKGDTSSIDYARLCMNLGYFHMLSTDYTMSGKYYSEAVSIWERNKRFHDVEYADALYFAALALQVNKKYEQAAKLLVKAEKIAAVQDHSKYHMYSPIISLLAHMQRITEDYAGAERSFNKYRDILKLTGDANPASWMVYYTGIAPIYEKQGKWKDADRIYTQYSKANGELINDLLQIISISSEKQLTQKFQWFAYNLNFLYSYCVKRQKETPDLLGQMYNNELIHKGLILRVIKEKIRMILNSGDIELISDFEKWLAVRQNLAKLYQLKVSDRKASLTVLEQEATELENRITAKLYDGKYNAPIKVDWRDVQKKLQPGEAAIEFLNYEQFDMANRIWSGKIHYGALIIRPGYKQPEYVPLFKEEDFQKFLDDNHEATPFDQVRKLYTWLPGQYEGYYKGDSLYKLVWKPLEAYLEGIKKIYYSPSGLLHKISFAAVPYAEEKSLINKYDLQLMSSTGLLTDDRKPFKLEKKYQALLYGGILYDLAPAEAKRSATKYQADADLFIRDRSFTLSRSLGRGDAWPYLEGSLAEVKQIQSLFEANGVRSEVRTGVQALEESFKKSVTPPDLIHIATHGFFFPEAPAPAKKEQLMDMNAKSQIDPDDSLKRSGLLFAGANSTWQGKYLPDGMEDGVLTAFEVSRLNLINTRLVVLSACETGLGEISGGEGVYGLQRAFKMAGVDFIMMSLWQIPDEQTVELMHIFYQTWLDGSGIRQAFHTAQQQMSLKYEPYFWGAFVLLE